MLHWPEVHWAATVQAAQFDAHWRHAWFDNEYPVAQAVQFDVPLQVVHPVEQPVKMKKIWILFYVYL